jgi:hypothetical protein
MVILSKTGQLFLVLGCPVPPEIDHSNTGLAQYLNIHCTFLGTKNDKIPNTKISNATLHSAGNT